MTFSYLLCSNATSMIHERIETKSLKPMHWFLEWNDRHESHKKYCLKPSYYFRLVGQLHSKTKIEVALFMTIQMRRLHSFTKVLRNKYVDGYKKNIWKEIIGQTSKLNTKLKHKLKHSKF